MADPNTNPAGDPGATPEPPAEPTTNPGGEPLGEPGLKALESERKARREAEARLKELKPLAVKARELEEAQKTETEKLTEAKTAAEKEALAAKARALRLEVALEKAPEGMPISRIRSLAGRLQGEDRESLEADAEELFSEFGTPTKPPSQNPTEKLRPSSSNPEADPPVDHDKLAEKILASKRM